MNEHLVYTHGYGQIVSTANDVTTEGQPDFLLNDIEDVYTVEGTPELTVEQPRLYFSDAATSRFLIVGTNEPEVDRPDLSGGAQVSYDTYDGSGGVVLGNIAQRAAWALRFGDLNTLISRQLASDSRVLLERNIRERVLRLVPFLATDADPYLVVADGRLKWVQDLYTVTDQYPYSQLADTSRLNASRGLPSSFNYIRNSVKAVVDAYDGTTELYIIDEEDPMIQAYAAHLPRRVPGPVSDPGFGHPAPPISRRPLPGPNGHVPAVPRDQPAELLQQRRPVADRPRSVELPTAGPAGSSPRRRGLPADAAVLPADETPR